MTIRTTWRTGARRVSRGVAAAVFAVAAGSLVCAPVAAAPATDQVAAGQPDSTDGRFLTLSIDAVTPSVVGEGGPGTVTVQGTVRNVGDRTVSDVEVRLQRAPAIAREDQLRSALGLDQAAYSTVGLFSTVAESLDRGASAPFTLSLPLGEAAGPSLGITEVGVYPLLVNVNGTPDYGGRARLDDARFLLPVLSLPESPESTASPENTENPGKTEKPLPDADTPDSPPAPTPVTLLYPLAAEPAAEAAPALRPEAEPGAHLADGTLPASLEEGGRLDGILAAAAEALDPESDPDGALARGVCLAVDPDLLTTVDAMTRGVHVAGGPSDPGAQAAAAHWLRRLRGLASRTCTVPLPYAQADLDVVHDLGSAPLTDRALRAPADIVDRILGVAAVRGLVWPSTGMISRDTAAGLGTALQVEGDPAVLLAHNAVDPLGTTAGTEGTGEPETAGPDGAGKGDGKADSAAVRLHPAPGEAVNAVLFDVPVSAAVAGAGAAPSTPVFVPDDLRYGVARDSRTARLQDALGALAWPALHGTGPTIIAPPQDWTVDGDEASALLALLGRLYDEHRATPQPLTSALAAAGESTVPAAELAGQAEQGDALIPEQLVDRITDSLPRLATLRGMLAGPAPNGQTPDEYVAPLYADVLRAVGTAGRMRADPTQVATAEEDAERRARSVNSTLTAQFAAVTVLSPGSVYTLASSQSPVLIVAQNNLPLPVQTGLSIRAPQGVKIGPADEYTVPGLGSRQIQVPAQIEYSRQIDLRVQLTTPDGTLLGEQIHIALHSNAYGMVIPILTGVSGALLLVLAGRRAWHRLRGQQDRADARADSRGPILEQYAQQDRRGPEDGG